MKDLFMFLRIFFSLLSFCFIWVFIFKLSGLKTYALGYCFLFMIILLLIAMVGQGNFIFIQDAFTM